MPDDVLSQEDIDALLQGREAEPAPTPARLEAPTASAVGLEAGEDDSSLLSQAEIDALLGNTSTSTASAPQTPVGQSTDGGLLSQDEIDALLQGLALERDAAGVAEIPEEVARPYDFASPDLGIRGFVFTLEMVNERFARHFRISLFNLLRHYGEISLYGIQVLKFGEYAHGLPSPVSVNLFRVKPLGGMAILVFDAQLVTAVVDVFFGGGRFRSRQDKREFTVAESRVIQIMVDRALRDLKESWGSVMPLDFEYLSSEINPHYASVIASGDMVIAAIFHISLEGIQGQLHVVFPYSMLEPLRELLTAPVQSKGLQTDQRFLSALRDGMKQAEVQVNCVLTETDLTLGDLIRLKPGDIVPIELPERVALRAEHVPVFWGKYGVSQGNWAVKIIEPVVHV